MKVGRKHLFDSVRDLLLEIIISSPIYILITTALMLYNLVACAPQPPVASPGHLNTEVLPPKNDIPPPVEQLSYVPPPEPTPPLETYTVVVNNVPVSELLFALARDVGIDVDIYPGITGTVTLNAISQTLPQILERIVNQVNLRYQLEGTHLIISPDLPMVRSYKVDYMNVSRDSTSEIGISTQISAAGSIDVGAGGTGGNSGGSANNSSGTNNSTATIKNTSNHHFWETLEKNIQAILVDGLSQSAEASNKANVIISPESGFITVRATTKQHKEIQAFLDKIMNSVKRQVLIEATVVEIQLSDIYQAGIDWKRISGDYRYQQSLTNARLAGSPQTYVIDYNNANSKIGDISLTLRLLEQFGQVKVLSSPRVMVLNNQTAILRVVDDRVFFTLDVQVQEATQVGSARTIYETKIHPVSVGLTMNVTPYISDSKVITLNVRPTISRIIGYVNDPNPELAKLQIESPIPEIQVREIESVLEVENGNVAVIGGLMEDRSVEGSDSVPLVSDLPVVGDLFSYRNNSYAKSELVIFLRPTVIQDASISGDLQDYKAYLPKSTDGVKP